MAAKSVDKTKKFIKINDYEFSNDSFNIIAGPCSVENEEQVFRIAEYIKNKNLKFLRAGAFKPRTSPYSFQGLGHKALMILEKVKKETGLLIVTEAMDVVTIDDVADVVDVIQIGSRSMQNFPLLRKAGMLKKPVLLKRGFSATLKELLLSAEYILQEGNQDVILCERGIRTFDNYLRNTLDIAAVPVLNDLTDLPVIVDPSHASGDSRYVLPLSRAALCVGAAGIMVEVHPEPDSALSDGKQSLNFSEFDILINDIRKLCKSLNRKCGFYK